MHNFKNSIEFPFENGGRQNSEDGPHGPRRFISSSGIGTVVCGTNKEKNEYLKELRRENVEEIKLKQAKIKSVYAVQRGTIMEEQAASYFEFMTGIKLRKAGFLAHKKISLLGASPDRISVCNNFGVEIKCPLSPKPKYKIQEHGTPSGHYWQCVLCAYLCGFPFWYYFVFHPEGENKPVKIPVIEKDIQWMQKKITEFITIMKKGEYYLESSEEKNRILGDMDNFKDFF